MYCACSGEQNALLYDLKRKVAQLRCDNVVLGKVYMLFACCCMCCVIVHGDVYSHMVVVCVFIVTASRRRSSILA